jgi:tellurite resistance protein TehA-like permease
MPSGYLGHSDAAFFLKLLSDLTGLWLWGLCLWFFLVSIGAHWQIMRPNDPEHHIQFDMTWFSFVFPNTALVTATQAIGKSLESNAIQVFGTVMAGLLVLVWIFVFYMMIRALSMKRLLWPGEADGSVALGERWRIHGCANSHTEKERDGNGVAALY